MRGVALEISVKSRRYPARPGRMHRGDFRAVRGKPLATIDPDHDRLSNRPIRSDRRRAGHLRQGSRAQRKRRLAGIAASHPSSPHCAPCQQRGRIRAFVDSSKCDCKRGASTNPRPPGAVRAKCGTRATIFRLVVSLNGLMRLDYTAHPPDDMTAQEASENMIDKAAVKLKSDGWSIVEATGFIQLIGPFWQRQVDGGFEYALPTQDKHHNRRGLVQGGVLMSFADRT